MTSVSTVSSQTTTPQQRPKPHLHIPLRKPLPPGAQMATVRIVCISDTHGAHEQLNVPEGDILIHAGDFSGLGKSAHCASFNKFMHRQPHATKVAVFGNHDVHWSRIFALQSMSSLLRNTRVLQNETITTAQGVRIFGSTFGLPRGTDSYSDLLPADTDVVVSHKPPYGVVEPRLRHYIRSDNELADRLQEVRPRLQIHGHEHGFYGITVDSEYYHRTESDRAAPIAFVNAATCAGTFRNVGRLREPLLIDMDVQLPADAPQPQPEAVNESGVSWWRRLLGW